MVKTNYFQNKALETYNTLVNKGSSIWAEGIVLYCIDADLSISFGMQPI